VKIELEIEEEEEADDGSGMKMRLGIVRRASNNRLFDRYAVKNDTLETQNL
jgi:hypothetical protein